MKDKIILTLHIHVLLFILVTPLTLLYSQQQISPGKRPAGLPKPQRIEKIIERKQATPVMITTPAQQKNEPSITNNESEIVTNSQDEQNNEESINKEEQKNEKNKENASLKSTTKAISESTPESQPTPSLWTVMYNLLPQIFIKSFSTGSEMGIGAATKTIIKQFMQKKQLETFIETSKQELEHSKEFLLTEEGQRQASKYPGIHKAIEQEETKLKHQELQKPSVSFIFSTAASTALIYTASTMMGEFAKIGLNIALQILVPQKQ